jgi:hypothetical protein
MYTNEYQINPANGMPMTSDYGVDVCGNQYGFSDF